MTFYREAKERWNAEPTVWERRWTVRYLDVERTEKVQPLHQIRPWQNDTIAKTHEPPKKKGLVSGRKQPKGVYGVREDVREKEKLKSAF